MKHRKVSEASSFLKQANQGLRVFQREVRDVILPSEVQVEINGFLTFADFFFDGLLADFLVQRMINQAREQADEAIWKTERTVNDLYRFR